MKFRLTENQLNKIILQEVRKLTEAGSRLPGNPEGIPREAHDQDPEGMADLMYLEKQLRGLYDEWDPPSEEKLAQIYYDDVGEILGYERKHSSGSEGAPELTAPPPITGKVKMPRTDLYAAEED